MLVKKEGRNYIVLRDGEKIPVKLKKSVKIPEKTVNNREPDISI